MLESWVFWVLLLLVFILVEVYRARGGPNPYRGRECTGRAWKRAFPHTPSDQIRTFLLCLVDGMAITHQAKLKFHPNDQVLDIYRSLYGGRTPRGDHLECETFLEDVARAFRTSVDGLLQVWHSEVTLGELFAAATKASRSG